MILWTIQELEVYREIQETGVYRCDPGRMSIPEFGPYYDWLAERMTEKIGKPPEGVKYPVWAYYKWEGARKKPDLRKERWENGFKGEQFVCLEIDIPGEQVVLSDFDAWCIILNNGLISDTREEDDRLEQMYDSLNPEEQRKLRDENWQRVFDLTPLNTDWITRGKSIQATFWELKREQIAKVRYFTAMTPKPAAAEF